MPAAPAHAPLKHRYFFALLPDEVTARRIHAFAEGQFGEKGLMRTDRLHVTLAITEDFDAPHPALADALCRAGEKVSAEPFEIRLDQLSGGRRTVALRPAHSIASLRSLQAQVSRAMTGEGVPMRPEWQFNPHVTLVYRDAEPVTRPIEAFGWTVREFVLIQSLVGLTRHQILGHWPLANVQPSLFPA